MSRANPSAPPPSFPESPSWAPGAIPRRASPPPRSRGPIVVVLTLLGLFAIAIGLGQATHIPLPDLSTMFSRHASPATPARISIPALDVRARVVAVGRADDGSIAVPTQDPVSTAGWYQDGVTPGQPGTAVIVGHVDTKTQAAVFARLSDLDKGDRIEITNRSGKVVSFAVDSIQRTPKTAFPAQTIFAPAPKPRLVLETHRKPSRPPYAPKASGATICG